ncbi:hypothetical protein FC25_GL000413 [Ligilactobacillus ruminis DSM 20403 = NBRC 102161]|nr:hypothetical protein FC25_GL000413 [Ligilactobacillus ruminis DSM 20403 = NBRC 102161]
MRVLRVAKGMTQKDAAKELGVNPGTLSKWERGLSFPNVVEIDRIQRLYNIGYADINFLNITRFNRIE